VADGDTPPVLRLAVGVVLPLRVAGGVAVCEAVGVAEMVAVPERVDVAVVDALESGDRLDVEDTVDCCGGQ
jgi:hypothetical protein